MSNASPIQDTVPTNVSLFLHRISQPATAILGYLELLLRDSEMTPADRKRMLANCHASARQMQAILESCHLLSDAGRTEGRSG